MDSFMKDLVLLVGAKAARIFVYLVIALVAILFLTLCFKLVGAIIGIVLTFSGSKLML